jgi:WD40 repeat protein
LLVLRFHFIRGGSRIVLALRSGSSGEVAEYTWPDWKPCSTPRYEVKAGPGGLSSCSISPDGKHVAFVSAGSVLLLERSAAPLVTTIRPGGWPVVQTAFSPDGKALALVYENGGAGLFSLKGRALRYFAAPAATKPTARVEAFFTPDGSSLLALRPDRGEAVCWSTRTGRGVRRRVPGSQCAALSPDGKQLHAVGPRSIRVLNAATLRLVREIRLVREEVPNAAAFTADGKGLLFTTLDGLRVLSAENGRPLRSVERHAGTVRRLAFSPDGRWLASGGDDGAVLLWDVARRRLTRALGPHPDGVASLSFSPDGRWLAVGDGLFSPADREATARLWEVKSGKLRWQARAHLGRVGSLAFFDGGKALVTAGPDGRVRWWATADGKRLGQDRFCIAPFLLKGGDGKQALYFESAHPESLWQLGPGSHSPRRVAIQDTINGPPDLFYRARFGLFRDAGMPDLLALPLAEGFELREAPKRTLGTWGREAGRPMALAFSSDGKWLASGGDDGRVLLWGAGQFLVQSSLRDWLGPASAAVSRRPDLAAARLVEALRVAARAEKAVVALVKRLKDDSFIVREEASAEAGRLGREALPIVMRAIRRSRDLEVKERLRKAVAKFPTADRGRVSAPGLAKSAARALKLAGDAKALRDVRELARSVKDTALGREMWDALEAKK